MTSARREKCKPNFKTFSRVFFQSGLIPPRLYPTRLVGGVTQLQIKLHAPHCAACARTGLLCCCTLGHVPLQPAWGERTISLWAACPSPRGLPCAPPAWAGSCPRLGPSQLAGPLLGPSALLNLCARTEREQRKAKSKAEIQLRTTLSKLHESQGQLSTYEVYMTLK